MAEMTKKEFAVRLLFWLFPWPISKALPKALRIYYFGPGGFPPPGFYDYEGHPGDFWWDPYNPPSPDEIPDTDPWPKSDPWPPDPGPGGPWIYPQPGKGDVFFNEAYWTPADVRISWISGHWHCAFTGAAPSTILDVAGTWFVNYRPSYIHIVWSGEDPQDINLALIDASVGAVEIATINNAERDFYHPITFGADDIDKLFIEQTDPGLNPININLIEFL